MTSCNESAPGPDGIPYQIYKDFWDILGPEILLIWEHSQLVKKLTLSQRYSVITLIEKKEKDKTLIENLRPISLTSCDIKICTKALAIRTSSILHKILVNTQCGYVPGRQISDNSRYLEEVITLAEQLKTPGYIVTLDAKKAFDSVDHKYMEQCLEAYGFPPIYVEWVKILYNDLTASVMVNGFTTDTFKILRSVKQGDALSCALFVICIDPLLRAIEKDLNIKVIQFAEIDNFGAIKTLSYADDITLICKDESSIQHALDIYYSFSKISGIDLNVPKTEILKIGCQEEDKTNNVSIIYNQIQHNITPLNKVKICGITFSTDNDIAYQDNIINKIYKLNNNLNQWKMRNLTLTGKIQIVKSLGLSQLTASLQQTYIKEQEIQAIEKSILRFLWNKKDTSRASGLVSSKILKLDYNQGGLKCPDIKSINFSLKYKNFLRTLNISHPSSDLYKIILIKNKLSMDYNPYNDISEHNKTNRNAKTFIAQAHYVHRQMASLTERDMKFIADNPSDEKIHKNYHITMQNINLASQSIFNINQNNAINRLRRNNVITYAQLVNKKRIHNLGALALDIHNIYHSTPKWWDTFFKLTNRRYEEQLLNQCNIDMNKWTDSNRVKASQIRQRLVRAPNNEPLNRIMNTFNITLAEGDNPFIKLRKTTNITQLRILQYKTLLNFYPTNSLLSKWGAADNDRCTHCGQKETVRHVIIECEIAIDSFNELRLIVNKADNIAHTSYETLPTHSIVTLYNIPPDLATLIILIKNRLLKQRENKRALSEQALLGIARDQFEIEQRIAYKTKKMPKHNKKWAFLKPVITITE